MLANFFSSFCILLFVLTTNTIKTSGNLEPTQIELNSLKQGFKVDSMFSSDIPNSMLFDSNVYYDDSFGDKQGDFPGISFSFDTEGDFDDYESMEDFEDDYEDDFDDFHHSVDKIKKEKTISKMDMVDFIYNDNSSDTQLSLLSDPETIRKFEENKKTFMKEWYSKANEYWMDSEMTYESMFGGDEQVQREDINFSKQFLEKTMLNKTDLVLGSVLDCACGIGRVSKQLLIHQFKTVDLVDQCQMFINKAKELLNNTNARNFYAVGVQDFEFTEKYDVIWVQWVLTQLSHEDAITFLRKAKQNLTKTGVIIVKENINDIADLSVDWRYNTAIISEKLFEKMFKAAGLTIILAKDMPMNPDYFGIRMYTLV